MKLLRWLLKVILNLEDYISDVLDNLEDKKRKKNIKKDIRHAQRILKMHGFTLDAEWLDMTYKGNRYSPILIEQDVMNEDDVILITAQKVN